MDLELANAVFERWERGLPVYEGTLYKAAEFLGMDPESALAEARFYHNLDKFLIEKRAMSFHEKAYFSTAAGINPLELVKTASSHFINTEELILRALVEKSFVPDLQKLAFMGMQGGPTEAPSMNPGGDGQGGGQGEYASAPVAPQPGAQVQQQPDARQMALGGGPTAPQQVPPSSQGNLSELLQGAQQADAAPMGGGLPPSGMGAAETPPPPSAEDKLQQAFGGQLDEDSLSRYAPRLEEFENQIGMSIQDPKQIEKFVKEIQKGEKKMVDEAIKQYGQQAAQEQQAASGMGGNGMAGGASVASFDQTAPKPKKPSGAPTEQGGTPEEAQVGAPPVTPDGGPQATSPGGPQPPVKKPQPQQKPDPKKDPASNQAEVLSKVAAVARKLARSLNY